MATRAIALPGNRDRSSSWRLRPGWAERVALPVLGLLVVTAAVVGLGVAVARIPDGRVAAGSAIGPVLPVKAIDPIAPLSATAIPASRTPLGGMAFVRCTNLWTAYADGSHAHRVMSMAGISAPTFSPDGRTIAFLAASAEGLQVWMVAADGSGQLLAGTLQSDGRPVLQTGAGLTWSPKGDRLAFALAPPPAIPHVGWTVWTLVLAKGRFHGLGAGGPAPFWAYGSLLDAGSGPYADFMVLQGRARWAAKHMSSATDDVSAALAPGWWIDGWGQDTAIVRRSAAGGLELQLRTSPFETRARHQTVTTPPAGWRISPLEPPAVLEGGPVLVTLIDAQGGRDLGVVDPATGEWTVSDYAWDPVWSSAPPASGPVEAQQAVSLVRQVLWSWDRPGADLVLPPNADRSLASLDRLGFTNGRATATGDGWAVPVTVFGGTSDGFSFRRITFNVHPSHGRLIVVPRATSQLEPVRTVDDGLALLRSMLTADVVPPAGLPEGTMLAEKNPIYAYSWGGQTTGSLNLMVPTAGGPMRPLTVNFGDAGFGCASPVPVTLETGTPAVATDPAAGATYNQVAWPAQPGETSGPFGLSGELPRTTLLQMAAAMDRERLATKAAG